MNVSSYENNGFHRHLGVHSGRFWITVLVVPSITCLVPWTWETYPTINFSANLIFFKILFLFFLKSLLNFYSTALFQVLIFWPWGMWDLSLPTRNRAHLPCIGRLSLNHWTTREVPDLQSWQRLAHSCGLRLLWNGWCSKGSRWTICSLINRKIHKYLNLRNLHIPVNPVKQRNIIFKNQ